MNDDRSAANLNGGHYDQTPIKPFRPIIRVFKGRKTFESHKGRGGESEPPNTPIMTLRGGGVAERRRRRGPVAATNLQWLR